MLLRSLLLTALLAAPAALANEAYEQALNTGKSSLDGGNPSAAFQELQRAVNADPSHYEGYFYLAIASYRLGNFSAAEDYAKLALARAPDTEKSRVNEMVAIIGEKRAFAVHEREGDEAFANGLLAKAAESYQQAFRLSPDQGGVGLKAAALYEQLEQYLTAARIWQRVAAGSDSASAAAARQELARNEALLEGVYNSEMQRLANPRGLKDPAPLLALVEAFPRKLQPRIEAAALYARQPKDVGAVVQQLKEAIKIGLKAAQIVDRPEFFGLIDAGKNGELFTQFVADAYGKDTVNTMRRKAPVPGYSYTVRGMGIDLVPIAAGHFRMGSPGSETGRNDDETPHDVTISRPYWMGKYEVTVNQWQMLMEDRFYGDCRDCPQTKSWGAAKMFCDKLTERERAAGRLPEGYVYSLPTEAEWEYAARAGTTGPYAGNYEAMAVQGDPNKGPQSVGQKQSNAWGLYDMHGNVAEWCLDQYGPYPTTHVVDPIGRHKSSLPVCRGGGVVFTAAMARSAARQKFFDFPYIGFRVALRPAQ